MIRLALALAAMLAAGAGTAATAQTAAPAIVEIRVHGNHSTPDADVIAASGLAVGEGSGDADLAAAAERLRASGRFRSVEVHRRLRSIDDPDDVLVLILIEELPGASPDLPTPGWLRRTASGVMWLPVLSYTEGYGVTYGLRVAADELLGPKSRVSVPLTWGGERRAGLVAERSFERGPFSRLLAGANVRRTEHPAFDLVERRVGGEVRAERVIASWLRAGASGRLDEVRFDGATSRVATAGGDLTLDTRLDPSFPRNAVWVMAGLERVGVHGTARRRHRLDANAALGLFRGSALSLRVFQISSDGPLPRFEQAWIGGASWTRGYRAGYRVDDNAAGATVSWALPLGSPLNVARTGLRVFADWAAVYPAKASWRDASYDRGIGAGWFASATAFTFSLDVARGKNDTRVHVRMGTRF
ncbi:MAG: FtsQ-type POTRA domain-containing protein [Vicinamibacterales bacterium]